MVPTHTPTHTPSLNPPPDKRPTPPLTSPQFAQMASVAAAFCRLTPESRTHSGALFQTQDPGRVRVKREETDNFDRLQVKGVESYPPHYTGCLFVFSLSFAK
ncbi:hypothetical protein CesoFtcFv8_015508 [Champsocephalus esox]|nr:hypothetical protein CesoFtcFv8_015508 [Champsocephalus esox]